MLSLLFALVVLPAQESPAATVGRVTFVAGGCSTIGWQGDRVEAERMGADLATSHPDTPEERLVAEATAASSAVEAEIRGEMDAVTDVAGFNAWADRMEARCDAVAAEYPKLLWRTAETPATWEGFKQQMRAQF